MSNINNRGNRNAKDLTGQKFNHLTILEEVEGYASPSGSHRRRWKCRCDCGSIVVVNQDNLIRKIKPTTSCGCTSKFWQTHKGMKRSAPADRYKERLYGIWLGMKARCCNPNNPKYERYGARGISVCAEWLNDYDAFKEWALNNGYDANLSAYECSIDRIDYNGNYCPENCRWVNEIVQNNNRCTTRKFQYNGEVYTLRGLSEISKLPMYVLDQRIRKLGWSIEEAVNIPKGIRRENYYAMLCE